MNTEQKFGLVNQQFGIIWDAIKNTQADVNSLSTNTSALDQLSDVNINSVVNGDTLVYNSTTSEWVNSAPSALPTLTGLSGDAIVSDGSGNIKVSITGNNNYSSGASAFISRTTATQSTAVGVDALRLNTSGNSNVGVGFSALKSNLGGNNNVAVGTFALLNNTGNTNTSIGNHSLSNNTSGSNNSAIGTDAGKFIADSTSANSTGSNSVFLGANTKALGNGETNQVVIGHNAIGNGANSITLGNTLITKTIIPYGNVGIGTNTPSVLLNVKGGLFPLKVEPTGSSTDGVNLTLGYNGLTFNTTAPAYKTFAITNSLTADALGLINFDNGGSTRMTIANAGNVGIGTTTPDYKLDINSTATYKTLMLRANALGTRFDVALEFNAVNVLTSPYARIGLQVTSASAGAEVAGLTFWTINNSAFSEKMCITAGGDVGIGTTTPANKLDVAGNVSSNSFRVGPVANNNALTDPMLNLSTATTAKRNFAMNYFNTDTLSSIIEMGKSRSSTLGTLTYPLSGDYLGRILFNGADENLSRFDVGGDISILCGSNWTSTSQETTLQITTTPAGATTRQVNLTMTGGGNVGIGTTTPTSKLHIEEPTTTSGSAGINVQKTGTITGNSYGVLSQTTGTATTNYAGFFTATGATNNYGLVVSAGNVGIGTTAPSVKLQVEGLVNSIDLVRLRALTGSGASDAGISFYAMATGANVDARNYKAVINNTAHGTFEIIQSTTNSNAPSVPVLSITKQGNVSTPTQTTAMGGLDAVFNMPLASTYYPMPFKTTAGPFNVNIGSNWNNSTYTYTAPTTGIYLICLGIYTDTVDRLGVFINGIRKINLTGYPSIAGADIWTGSCMVSMTAADTLQFHSYSESAGAIIQYDYAYTFFQLRLLG